MFDFLVARQRSSSIRLEGRRVGFNVWLEYVLFYGLCGVSRTIGLLKVGKRTLVRLVRGSLFEDSQRILLKDLFKEYSRKTCLWISFKESLFEDSQRMLLYLLGSSFFSFLLSSFG